MAKTAHKAIAVIGIDIGKYSFHGADHDKRGTFAAAEVVAWLGANTEPSRYRGCARNCTVGERQVAAWRE